MNHAECKEELHSWDYFKHDQVDSYYMRCHMTGAHDEHKNSETGTTWSTAQGPPTGEQWSSKSVGNARWSVAETPATEVPLLAMSGTHGTLSVNLYYPRVKDNIDTVIIGLDDVRAADDLIIRYDFDRDGWVVYMDLTSGGDGGREVVAAQQEVAFIPAWNTTRDVTQ